MKKKVKVEYILIAHCMDMETVNAGIAGMWNNNKDGMTYTLTAINPKLIREKGSDNTNTLVKIFSDLAKSFRKKSGAMRK